MTAKWRWQLEHAQTALLKLVSSCLRCTGADQTFLLLLCRHELRASCAELPWGRISLGRSMRVFALGSSTGNFGLGLIIKPGGIPQA